jgi:hypothetical protein
VWPKGLTVVDAAAFADVSRRNKVEGARHAHEELRLELREAKLLDWRTTLLKRRPEILGCVSSPTDIQQSHGRLAVAGKPDRHEPHIIHTSQ